MAHKIVKGASCPRCSSPDVAHPTNYGRPQLDRRWCLACGALWTPLAAPRPLPPALLTRIELDQWLAGLGLPREERRRLTGGALAPRTFTTPAGDYWTIEPLVTGAYLVAPGLPAEE